MFLRAGVVAVAAPRACRGGAVSDVAVSIPGTASIREAFSLLQLAPANSETARRRRRRRSEKRLAVVNVVVQLRSAGKAEPPTNTLSSILGSRWHEGKIRNGGADRYLRAGPIYLAPG